VPGLLLLVAADVLLRGPSHALAWRLLHDPQLVSPPGWLRPWLPAGAAFDRDPLALLLAGGATMLAALYLACCLLGARARVRAGVIAAAFALVVVLPSFLYVSVGVVTGRPFGQDGGVVQLPLALDRLLEGRSPYGADYSDSMLGRQARASAFWRAYGGNPIVRHHAYLPGTHLVMLPPYLAARVGGVPFDTRLVTLLALVLAAWLAAGFFEDAPRRLSAAALVALHPLIYWHQAFGANDMLFVAMLLGAARLFGRGREAGGGALLGLACATKQLAWPFAPFLLLTLAGERLRRAVLAAAAVFLLAVAPVAALDPRAFWGDIVLYNAGLGGDLYPFGGTPGIGFANLVLAWGGVRSLSQPFSFATPALLLSLPLLSLFARDQWRRRDLATAFAAGSVALLLVLYFNRVPHANYLIAAAVLLPLAALLGRLPADAALVPLLLLLLATTAIERGAFQLLAHDAGAAALASNPYDLAFSAVASGLAVAYAAAAVLGARPPVRAALVVASVLALVAAPALLASQARAPRAQEGALVPSAAAREAWSPSFRQEPPASLQERQADTLAARAVSRALRAAGIGDGRVLGLVALAAALGVAARLAPGAQAAAWAVVALAPATAFGAVFGSEGPLWLAAALFALWFAARRSLPTARGAGALLVLAALVDSAFARTDPGAGLGLVNLAAYAGWESAVSVPIGRVLGQLAAVAAAFWTWRRAGSPAEVLSGLTLALLFVLVSAPAASPFRLGLPTALVCLAVLMPSAVSRSRA
jgi:hypothetical protein